MKTADIKNLTPYQDVNDILAGLADELQETLQDQLVGLYLTGSLTYGDFDKGSSDIDFLAVLTQQLSDEQLEQVKQIHEHKASEFPEWAKRIEGSYITNEMLANDNPPEQPRPYVNNAKMNSYRYGNEWVLNLYVLHECGIALVGPAAKDFFPKISIERVREFSKKDLHDDWQSKLDDLKAFDHEGYEPSHIQAYAILTMCRVLHRAKNENVASKRVASAWVKENYPQWRELIEKAENWQHGEDINAERETRNFIQFTISEVG